ncbi:hypothetical protein HCN52_04380 [Streptomyces bohaiensis]|uniref:Uncharacterized protein n=2 Tax=Streptomyces bohaiensis TaxID=1431344 RepID=A0ABX1C4R4_9ACTN|nr:hypothetical protein [Streptomyces bohaiensis]
MHPNQPQPSADDFLMGGSGSPSAKFPAPGTTIGGVITEKPTVEQQRDIESGKPKHWSDGNPMMQLVVTVQTDQRDPSIDEDSGKRRIYVKGQMRQAVADAVRAAGARGLEVGGELHVTYSHDGKAKTYGFTPPKQYTARYVPAATTALHTPDPGMAPPVAQAPPAPTPQQQYAQPNPAVQALQQQQAAATAQAAHHPGGQTTPPF